MAPNIDDSQTGISETHIFAISIRNLDDIDHTMKFVKGFITCLYSEDQANQIVNTVNNLKGLNAYRLSIPLYADNAYPVVVEAIEVELEADGAIRSHDALRWFAQEEIKNAWNAEIAEIWQNMRPLTLGCPHGSNSSLFVNQRMVSTCKKF